LFDATGSSMSVIYCREPGGPAWRWLRGLTIDVNFDFRRWRKHQQATKHLTMWTPGAIIRADNTRRLVYPDLLVVGAIGMVVSLFNVFLGSPAMMMVLPMQCFSLTSAALGLLVTFKTQQCYGRFDDARGQWGLIVNESRSFSARVLARLPSHRGGDLERVMTARTHALKVMKSFPHTLKYHLTEDGCNPHIRIKEETTDAEIKKMTTSALRAELHGIWDMNDPREAALVDRMLGPDTASRPLFCLHQLSKINGKVFADPLQGGLDPMVSADMDRSMTLFQHVLGRCERILRTPIYTPYSKFTARFLCVWCGALPLALYPLLGPWGTTPVAVVISFFLLGIQDIGTRVEQPFDVLPLWQYCQVIDGGIDQMIRDSTYKIEAAADDDVMRPRQQQPPPKADPKGNKPLASLNSMVDLF